MSSNENQSSLSSATANCVEAIFDAAVVAIGDKLVVIGDRFNLYRSMAATETVTPRELAARTRTNELYLREWLNALAERGLITYDEPSGTFRTACLSQSLGVTGSR